MAMMRDESGGGKKTYPVGSPEWLREQKLLADQKNRQRFLDQQRHDAAEKRIQQEEIPLPSGDTATRNPVDTKPITYTPDIEDLEREELRKTKKAAIERTRDQRYTPEPKKPRVSGPQNIIDPTVYQPDQALYFAYTDNIKEYLDQGYENDISKTKAALDIVADTESADPEINTNVIDYFNKNTSNPDTKRYLSEIYEQINNPNMNVVLTGYTHKELDEKDAKIETNKLHDEYSKMFGALSTIAGLAVSPATLIWKVVGAIAPYVIESFALPQVLPDVLPGTYDTIRVQLYNNNGEDSGSYNITIGPEGSLLVRNDYVRGTSYYTTSRTESPYQYDPINGLTHK